MKGFDRSLAFEGSISMSSGVKSRRMLVMEASKFSSVVRIQLAIVRCASLFHHD